MTSGIKRAVKGLARGLGFEIKNLAGIPKDEVPAWQNIAGPLPEDEKIPGPWVSSVLEMVTHAHRPAHLGYHRRVFGEDYRIKYVASLLDVRGLRVLELGPYEAYWSVLLEKLGVRENVSLELRPENLARCQRIKEMHRLDRTTFLQQNVEDLYHGKETPRFSGPFDLVFCLGFLYHIPEPAKALKWCRSQSPRLFLGTLYVEPAESGRYLPELFRQAECREDGKVYRGMEYREGGLIDPVSGASAYSFWPYEADLIAMLRNAGYSQVHILGKDLLNRMPHITLMAE